MHKGGVYIIRNMKTGQYYIGSSIHPSLRWTTHLRELKQQIHHSFLLQQAYNKYGEEAFTFELLEEGIPSTLLVEREQHYINKHQSVNPEFGYNVCPTAYSSLGYKHSEESKRKISEGLKGKNKGRVFSPEQRAKMKKTRKPRKPYKWSEEAKQRFKQFCQNPKERERRAETARKMHALRRGGLPCDTNKNTEKQEN